MKKTLLETLSELKADETVYLATKKGTNWIAIDDASTIIENLDKIDKVLYKNIETSIEKAQESIDSLPGLMIKTREKISECNNEFELKELKGKLDRIESGFVAAFNARQSNMKYLSNWVEIKDRNVVEVYQHNTDIVGPCIIVEGIDDGHLWYKGESKPIY